MLAQLHAVVEPKLLIKFNIFTPAIEGNRSRCRPCYGDYRLLRELLPSTCNTTVQVKIELQYGASWINVELQ